MDWAQILEAIGGTTAIVAGFAAVANLVISHFLSRRLNKTRAELETKHNLQMLDLENQQASELEKLRGEQQTALAQMRAEADQRLEHLKSSLDRMERLEADLAESRGEGYGEIWTLTGSLNLFGPTTEVDIEDLSGCLKDWYFEHGWVLSEPSKKRYFLVQEVLSYATLRSATFERPDGEKLYSDKRHPVQVLRRLRLRLLGKTASSERIADMEAWVSCWKMKDTQPDENWILLQLIMSRFRSCIIKELFFGIERPLCEDTA